MRVLLAAALFVIGAQSSTALAAQQMPSSAQAPVPGATAAPTAGQQPASPGAQPGAPPAAPTTAPATATPATTPAATQPPALREFSAPAGMIFNTVRPERVADFEKVIAYLQAALEKSTDPMVLAQAKGWRVFKASETGPNGVVVYVFLLDPTVPKSEYGLGRILADAYPDPVQLQMIWKLYTSSVTSGGTLMNLTPVHPELPPAGLEPLTPQLPAPDPTPRMLPPTANPN